MPKIFRLPLIVSLSVAFLLTMVQLKVASIITITFHAVFLALAGI